MTVRWGWFLVIPLLISLAFTGGTQVIFLEKSFFRDLGYGQIGAAVGFANYWAVLKAPLYVESIVTTLRVSALSTIGCILFGYPVAYAIARMRGRWATVMLSSVLVVSLVTEPIKVLGLMIIFERDGIINRLLLWSGLFDRPIGLIGTDLGVVVGLMYYSLAFAVLLLYSVIRTIPPMLEEAAEIHGSGRGRVLWRVVVPLSLPGVYMVAVTIFNLSMGAFASPFLMGGGRVLTLPVLTYQRIFVDTKYAMGSTLSAILVTTVLLVNFVSAVLLWTVSVGYRRRSSLRRVLAERWRDLFRGARVRVSRRAGIVLAPLGRLLARFWVGWVYVFLFAPLVVIVGASFNGGSTLSGAIVFPPRHISFDWYLATPASQVHAFAVSLALATCAASLGCLIALPAGLGLARTRLPGREIAAALFRIPLQIPVVIIGLSFFYTYYAVYDLVRISLVGSFLGLALAHFFVVTPFVIGSITTVLQRFDARLEEAAASLGAGLWRSLRRVTLPVIAPGVFAGVVYAFLVSFGDVPISLFLAGPDTTTFPVAIFHSMEMDFNATVLSSSTLVMVFGMGVLLLVQRLIGLDALTHLGAGAQGGKGAR